MCYPKGSWLRGQSSFKRGRVYKVSRGSHSQTRVQTPGWTEHSPVGKGMYIRHPQKWKVWWTSMDIRWGEGCVWWVRRRLTLGWRGGWANIWVEFWGRNGVEGCVCGEGGGIVRYSLVGHSRDCVCKQFIIIYHQLSQNISARQAKGGSRSKYTILTQKQNYRLLAIIIIMGSPSSTL